MKLRKMWAITFWVLLVDFIALNLVGMTSMNFNIYTTAHKVLGQMDPGILRAVFAIALLIYAKREWKIDVMHQKGGYMHMFKDGWLMIVLTIMNITVASDTIVWKSLLYHMNAFNIVLAFGVGLIEALFVGMFEEISIRGVMMGAMLKGFKKYPVMKSIFFSSIVFGSLHMLNYFVAPFWDTTNQVIYAAGLGFVLATVYYVSKNIWVSIVLHAAMDYSSFVFSMNSIYVNTGSSNSIDLLSVAIFVVGLLSSYLSLLIYNRKQGKKDLLF
ncbi:hypothetical protein RZ71_02610 [Apilactobacillus kunkeei]|uniref:CAAX prenyl protease 2/Lysostaphin resistance protein A-like domain-containing protein n=1 Tax=Apilactobacillus kunkeei TaxID=148814 RepID=A0A0M9DBY2_9LACO|nr:type II CAAX endopeptidase family protein [Apilactobacillus kunkeei]KOY75840.1 hypothetical protein RZ71_02610 [Apilactobacillus kunkeei]